MERATGGGEGGGSTSLFARGLAGAAQGEAADVVVEVEVGIVHPHRVVPVEGDVDQAASERGHQVEALGDEVLDLVEGIPTGHRGRVQHHGHGHMHVVRGRLQVQEGGV